MILSLNWQIIWVFVNLLILFFLMKKFLFGRVNKVIDARAKQVSDTIKEADNRLKEAEAMKAEYTQQLADARNEAVQIVDEAQKRAELAYTRRVEEAQNEAARLNVAAERQRKADRDAMISSAKQQITELVLMTTAKVSGQTLDADSDKAMIEAFLDEEGEK